MMLDAVKLQYVKLKQKLFIIIALAILKIKFQYKKSNI